jgi:hypothetical protein
MSGSSTAWKLFSLRYHEGVAIEPVAAGLATLVGIVLTSYGAFSHTATAMAPGSALALLGGAWLGNCLARRNPFRTR